MYDWWQQVLLGAQVGAGCVLLVGVFLVTGAVRPAMIESADRVRSTA
jgi:hypothetical protein